VRAAWRPPAGADAGASPTLPALVAPLQSADACSVAASRDGCFVATAHWASMGIEWHDCRASPPHSNRFDIMREENCGAFALSGNRFAMCKKHFGVLVYRVGVEPGYASWQSLHGNKKRTTAVVELPGGRVAMSGWHSAITLLRTHGDEWAVEATLRGHRKSVYCLTWTQEGTLVSGGEDHTLRTWDVGATPPRCADVLRTPAQVTAVCTLADGRVASGHRDGVVRVWRLSSRACVATVAAHSREVRNMAALDDGSMCTSSWDGVVRLWDVGVSRCVSELVGEAVAGWAPFRLVSVARCGPYGLVVGGTTLGNEERYSFAPVMHAALVYSLGWLRRRAAVGAWLAARW